MKQRNSINGRTFREMFTTATNWLEKSVPEIDALNVFLFSDNCHISNIIRDFIVNRDLYISVFYLFVGVFIVVNQEIFALYDSCPYFERLCF